MRPQCLGRARRVGVVRGGRGRADRRDELAHAVHLRRDVVHRTAGFAHLRKLDDAAAKATVTEILRDWFGWESVIDLGDITTARGTVRTPP